MNFSKRWYRKNIDWQSIGVLIAAGLFLILAGAIVAGGLK